MDNQITVTSMVRDFLIGLGEGAIFDRDEFHSQLPNALQSTSDRKLRLWRKQGISVPCIDRRKGLYFIKEIRDPSPEGQLSLFEESGTDPSPQDSGSIPTKNVNNEGQGKPHDLMVHLASKGVHTIQQCLATRNTFPIKKCTIEGCTETTCESHPSRFDETEEIPNH